MYSTLSEYSGAIPPQEWLVAYSHRPLPTPGYKFDLNAKYTPLPEPKTRVGDYGVFNYYEFEKEQQLSSVPQNFEYDNLMRVYNSYNPVSKCNKAYTNNMIFRSVDDLYASRLNKDDQSKQVTEAIDDLRKQYIGEHQNMRVVMKPYERGTYARDHSTMVSH